ncbi:MAG: CHASE2 domain-containing protein [Treponema sp.]|jgi:adenylate cyclase|nr:CHASE2 domain-containing protein [Treponema sp.]
MNLWKNALAGFAVSALFALLYLTGILTPLEDRFYDFLLNFRTNRQRTDSVVFLDVDDTAIAYNGVYPWPRSIPADGLLRLKEYGTRAAIFDIEYIDQGPQGVDSLYLNQGLGNDFDRSFTGIDSVVADVFSALRDGRLGRNDIDGYSSSISAMIGRERENLYARAQGVARDNDRYLAQALALFGHSWSTLNLRKLPLDGEQAERRPIAEEHFSYPVNALPNANTGAGFVDILPALPVFAYSVKGAGFTNVEIDDDGIRRRIYLAQNINDHWYLQLAFAPLIDYLGRPDILLEKQKLTIKQARLPDAGNNEPKHRDIVIPLDSKGRMLLDWPKEDFPESYSHISFAQFSLLDEIEAELEKYSRALASADLMLFVQVDSSLFEIPFILDAAGVYLDAAYTAKNHALENSSIAPPAAGDYFDAYLEYRNQSYALLAELLALDPAGKIQGISLRLSAEFPESAGMIEDEADYIMQLVNVIDVNLRRWNELNETNSMMLKDRFCIIGRVDTGTTDYGANPFYGKYVNVGTHGVVLDTILSETFIVPLSLRLNVLLMLIIVPLFFLASARLSPVPRFAAGFGVTVVIIAAITALLRFAGIFWGPSGIIFAMISAVITREIISYAGSEKEKNFIRTAFSTYVSHDVVKEIISDPSRLQLGGTKRHMTAIFTDVQGFSTISEQLDPEDLVSLLNRYLSAMSDVVLAEKGTIDKYEGDAIVAFFGAPLELKDHALRACVSSITMKKKEALLNQFIMENKLSPYPLLTRIGINTGDMVAGNMGTENKMNYTIMGNAVNLAARLEGVNKQYGTWILASESAVRETGDLLLTRKLDRVRVVGINEPVRLYELIDTAEQAGEQQKKMVNVFHKALDCFEKRNWKQAADGFREAAAIKTDDHPSKIFCDRSVEFLNKAPEDAWDGVYNLIEK